MSIQRKGIESKKKGKTFEEMHGEEKANKLKKDLSSLNENILQFIENQSILEENINNINNEVRNLESRTENSLCCFSLAQNNLIRKIEKLSFTKIEKM